jgi:ferrochelatase
MWVRLIHLAQQQQRNTYKIFKFPKDSMDGKWGFTNFAEAWNGRLAMMGFIIGLGTELLTGQGILDQMVMG